MSTNGQRPWVFNIIALRAHVHCREFGFGRPINMLEPRNGQIGSSLRAYFHFGCFLYPRKKIKPKQTCFSFFTTILKSWDFLWVFLLMRFKIDLTFILCCQVCMSKVHSSWIMIILERLISNKKWESYRQKTNKGRNWT